MATATYNDWQRFDNHDAVLLVQSTGLKILKARTVLGDEILHLSSEKCKDYNVVKQAGVVKVERSGVNYFVHLIQQDGSKTQLDCGFMLA